MTSSKIEIPGEVKSDPAALMASLQLMPNPVPNPEIKYTKVCPRPAADTFGCALSSEICTFSRVCAEFHGQNVTALLFINCYLN